MIGIICALAYESELIKAALAQTEEKQYSGITFVKGTYDNNTVVCAVCGIGKVFAALCAQTMILKYAPDVVINTGVGGALAEDLHTLDCVVSDKTVQHDLDTTAFGDPPGCVSGINIVYFNTERALSALMLDCLKSLGVPCRLGTIATADQFISDTGKKNYIVSTFNASVCDMESAAMAQVCYVNNVKFIAVRAISDNGDEDSPTDYLQMSRAAAKHSAAATLEFIRRIKNYETDV